MNQVMYVIKNREYVYVLVFSILALIYNYN